MNFNFQQLHPNTIISLDLLLHLQLLPLNQSTNNNNNNNSSSSNTNANVATPGTVLALTRINILTTATTPTELSLKLHLDCQSPQPISTFIPPIQRNLLLSKILLHLREDSPEPLEPEEEEEVLPLFQQTTSFHHLQTTPHLLLMDLHQLTGIPQLI